MVGCSRVVICSTVRHVHMAGHWDADGSQMAEAIQRVVAAPNCRATGGLAFPWWLER